MLIVECIPTARQQDKYHKLNVLLTWTYHSVSFNSLRLLALPFLATLSFRACCSLKWSSSALRSRPGHAHIRPSNDLLPNTWPLIWNGDNWDKIYLSSLLRIFYWNEGSLTFQRSPGISSLFSFTLAWWLNVLNVTLYSIWLQSYFLLKCRLSW